MPFLPLLKVSLKRVWVATRILDFMNFKRSLLLSFFPTLFMTILYYKVHGLSTLFLILFCTLYNLTINAWIWLCFKPCCVFLLRVGNYASTPKRGLEAILGVSNKKAVWRKQLLCYSTIGVTNVWMKKVKEIRLNFPKSSVGTTQPRVSDLFPYH